MKNSVTLTIYNSGASLKKNERENPGSATITNRSPSQTLSMSIYPTELQLNRENSSDTEAFFLDLNLCISNGTVSTKIYDKREDFEFDIVNFPFLDGDVPRRTPCEVHISQLFGFARASSNINDFNYRNKIEGEVMIRNRHNYPTPHPPSKTSKGKKLKHEITRPVCKPH